MSADNCKTNQKLCESRPKSIISIVREHAIKEWQKTGEPLPSEKEIASRVALLSDFARNMTACKCDPEKNEACDQCPPAPVRRKQNCCGGYGIHHIRGCIFGDPQYYISEVEAPFFAEPPRSLLKLAEKVEVELKSFESKCERVRLIVRALRHATEPARCPKCGQPIATGLTDDGKPEGCLPGLCQFDHLRAEEPVQPDIRTRIAQILNNHGSNTLYKLEQIRKLVEEEGINLR